MDPYSVLDIAPAILYFQGFPLPESADKKIVTKAKEKSYIYKDLLFSTERLN